MDTALKGTTKQMTAIPSAIGLRKLQGLTELWRRRVLHTGAAGRRGDRAGQRHPHLRHGQARANPFLQIERGGGARRAFD